MGGEETRTDFGSDLRHELGGDGWVLSVALHPDAGCIGRRLALGDDDEVVVGRRGARWPEGTFDDSLVSRRHLVVRCQAGRLTVEDLGSRNGTYKNGERITQASLAEGDVITVGRLLLLAHLGPRLHRQLRDPTLVGVSAAMSRVVHRVAIAAPQQITVLVRGETGVGKELVSRALHEQSGRSGRFMALNCSAVADGVLHSELFGHLKGSYSGACDDREGLVAAARGGTLLLDEIGDASPLLQASLLRLLEQREYRAVGSEQALHTDARFVAATHTALEEAVEAGRFRADLYGRLNRWCIDVPPLRDRREDIIPLAIHFAQQLTARPEATIARSLAHALLRYHWPANVRELRSVIEQAALESSGSELLTMSEGIEQRLALAPASAPKPAARPAGKRQRRGVRRKRPEATSLREMFAAAGGNARALAAELGVGPTTLYRWFREAGIDVRQLRDER